MRKLLLLIVLFGLLPLPQGRANLAQVSVSAPPTGVTFVQAAGQADTGGGGTQTTLTITLASQSSGGPFCIAVILRANSGTPGTGAVTDSASNSYTRVDVGGSGLTQVAFYRAVNATSSPTTVTATFATNDAFFALAEEYGNCGGADGHTLTENNGGTGICQSGTNTFASSVTTTTTNTMVAGLFSWTQGGTINDAPGTGETGGVALNSGGTAAGAYDGSTFRFWGLSEHKTAASAGSVSSTSTLSSSPSTHCVAEALGFSHP